MPSRSPDCKSVGHGILEKLRVRRPPIRVPNQRRRSEGYKQLQRRSGMIVTMSVEQSGGIALKTAEGVATSRTRQVSTTSTLFSPLGVSIGVVCESTTQNKEVVLDVKKCSNDNTKVELEWNNADVVEYSTALKKPSKSSTLGLRKSLSFLEDNQFEILSALNVKNMQQLLNIPLKKLLEIKLSNEQLLLLVAVLENEISTVPKSLELSAEDIQSFKSIAEELEKMDAVDDDDEQPLVIDESISNIEGNIALTTNGSERSLDEIEECVSKIRNVKIPQSRAGLKGVRSELSEIIAVLNGKENKLLHQIKKEEQPNVTVNNELSIGVGTEEIVTTTTETGKLAKPAKRTKGPRTAKRRRRVKKGSNLKPSTKVTNKNTDKNISCDMTLDINSTYSLPKSFEESSKIYKSSSDTLSALDVISRSTSCGVTTPLRVNPLSMLDTTASQISPTLSGSRGIFFINPCSMVILHEDIVKGSGLIDGPIGKTFNKHQQNPQFNQGAVLVDVSESNSMMSAPEQLLTTPNETAVSAVPLIQPDLDDTQTLPKEYVDCKVQKNSKPSKSFSAGSTQRKLQPTVLIKKLPTPLRKSEHNVDADSTTTSIDLRSSKATKTQVTVDGKSSCAESCDVDVAKNTKTARYAKKIKKHLVKAGDLTGSSNDKNRAKPSNLRTDTSDNLEAHGELDASEVSDITEVCVVQATVSNLGTISDEGKTNASKNGSKSISPESPLFESTKRESDKFEESGIVEDVDKSSPVATNSSNEERKNQSLTSYCSSSPKENCEDSRIRSLAQRRIEFDLKSRVKTLDDYKSYEASSIVSVANTPLSPISSGIASPINTNTKFRDYNPTTEIDGCCEEIMYLLKEIDIPKVPVNKPDDLDLLMRTNTSDPRLIKYLKKHTNAISASSSPCAFSKSTQNDPRRTSSIYNSESYLNQRSQEPRQQTPNMLLYGCLQRSPWYQSLMSTMKIQINQTISVLVRAINNFQKIRLEDPYAVFDIFKLYCAGELLEILENLGLFVDVNGIVSEKKNISSYAGRSYGCSSVVNATYSFIQPAEPSSVTVQHQQMRSFTAPRTNYSATPSNFSGAPSTFQTAAPFISCYIDSPQMAIEKPVQLIQPPLPRPPPTHSRAPFAPPPPTRSRSSFPPLQIQPRRHCGLKVPYSSSAPPSRPSVSPVKQQVRCSDSEEECWDLDEDKTSSTPSKLPLSPNSDSDNGQSHRNYPRSERFEDDRSTAYGRPFGGHKKGF